MTLEAPSSLPPSKLSPPVQAAFQVQRTSLVGQLTGAAAKLVVIRAPAGFGKTTSMAQYYWHLRHSGRRVAWVNLDASDNDAGRFFQVLAAAASILEAGIDARSQAKASAAASAGDFIARLAALSEPATVFFDEFEQIHSPTILNYLRQAIELLGTTQQLVIGTREWPDLGLPRHRAKGHLLELGADELRFSLAEIDGLLRGQRHLPLDEGALRALQTTTEGWVAALHLAVISPGMRDDPQKFIANFPRTDRHVADYLAEDVLARQPQQVQSFLIKTSILPQLSAALCDALTGRSDSSQMLERLERSGLFITCVDEQRVWYRYHSLFAEILRTRLQEESPLETAQLHAKAARWLSEQNRPIPAIDHAFAADNMDLAVSLIKQHAEEWLREGRLHLLRRWFDLLPAAVLEGEPDLRIVAVWVMGLTRREREALAVLDDLATRENDRTRIDRITAMRAVMLIRLDRFERAAQLLQTFPADSSIDPFTRSWLMGGQAWWLMADNRFDEAVPALESIMRNYAGIGSSFGMSVAEYLQGEVELVRGNLRNALVRFRSACAIAEREHAQTTASRALASAYMARGLYESGNLEEARRRLEQFLPFSNEVGLPDLQIFSRIILSRIAMRNGDSDTALEALAELQRLGQESDLPRLVAAAWLERARLAALDGRIDYALDCSNYARTADAWPTVKDRCMPAMDVDFPDISTARTLIHAGRAREALPILKAELDTAERLGRHRRGLKIKLLLALGLDASGQNRAAIRMLRSALQLAAREGFVQTVVEEGQPMRELIRRLGSLLTPNTAATDPIAMFVERMQTGQRVAKSALPEVPQSKPAPPELTVREAEVLRLAEQGCSNRSIAETLAVAETTVKTHLRQINTKLGASSRTHAIAVARKAGLL